MKERIYLNSLYDYYGTLLTPKQQLYFEDYYFHNLSLAEISENYNVSRNAVHKQLKDVEEKLNDYESKLKLYEKGKKIRELTKHLDKNLREKIEELI
ncbi:MAG: HTH domain-containing protein [Mollicutes bacterium]|mgnify:CR=1 FL=1|nr:HTH domain-containing protein [Mollicutes bacterium]